MIHEVCVYFLVMFSFSNLKVIQNHYLSFSVHGKIILFILNMTKKENLVRKLRGGKEKKANKGFISCPIIHTDKLLLTVLSLPGSVLSV